MRIQAIYDSLKSAERRLADYILKHPKKVANSTIQQVEVNSGSSYATIIRFCKRVGYHGFKELKTNLRADLEQGRLLTTVAAGFQITFGDSIESTADKIFKGVIQTLTETRNILNIAEMEKAVSILLDGDEIYFIGTGLSSVVAHYGFSRFFRLGFRCSWEDDPTIYKLKVATMKPPSVLFAISSSGRTANIVEAAKIGLQNGLPIVSLTDFAISPLSRVATCNLYTTPRNTTQFYELDVQLSAAQLNIIDVLFFSCCTRMGQKAAALLAETKRLVDKEKMR